MGIRLKGFQPGIIHILRIPGKHSNIREVKARGAVVLAVTTEKNREQAAKVADEVITIPDMDSDLTPLCAVTLLQLFAYYMSVLKGCDVDKPRNLAKSVTVE